VHCVKGVISGAIAFHRDDGGGGIGIIGLRREATAAAAPPPPPPLPPQTLGQTAEETTIGPWRRLPRVHGGDEMKKKII